MGSNRKEYLKQWKENNPDYAKQWNRGNPEKVKKYQKEYRHTLRGRFFDCKNNAKKRGFIFRITFDEFVEITNQPCHYCGGEGYGIDRLDNTIGYLKDNIVSCCSMCNFMKKTYTKDKFINQCAKIYTHWNERK